MPSELDALIEARFNEQRHAKGRDQHCGGQNRRLVRGSFVHVQQQRLSMSSTGLAISALADVHGN
ncbi:hypothetical protein ACWHLZ_46725 [Streptomyces chartreusis]